MVSGDSAIACVEDDGSMLRVVLEMMPGVVLDSTMGAISSASIYEIRVSNYSEIVAFKH